MNRIAASLLRWYDANQRVLPWRTRPTPYRVWVSEIMLQQTRVQTVIPYFTRWMRAFPTVRALAQSDERGVLKRWEGLGYYSRARNLHRAAGLVMRDFGGKLPRDVESLRRLPGIGSYTAAAIASIAFGVQAAALDGNIRRVYARLFDVKQYVDSSAGESVILDHAQENLSRARPGDFNQALMDLGALVCVPRDPHCDECPLRAHCLAYARGTQHLRPRTRAKPRPPQVTQVAAVIIQRGRVLLRRRAAPGLLSGLWEFPNARVEDDPARAAVKAIKAAHGLEVRSAEPLIIVRHAYTHFKVTVHAYRCTLVSIPKKNQFKWIRLRELSEYPMGRVDRQIADKIK